MVAALAKTKYMVQYRVEEHQPLINCRIVTNGLQELHRILTEFTLKRTPIREWDTLIIHEHSEGGDVAEWSGKTLGLLYDDLVTFTPELKLEEVDYIDTTYLKVSTRNINLKTKPSVMEAPFAWVRRKNVH